MITKQNPHPAKKTFLAGWRFAILPVILLVLLFVGGRIGSEVLIGISLVGLVITVIWGALRFGSF